MKDVSPLEADPEFVTGNVEVVIRRVGEVCPIVKLKCDNIIIKKKHVANTLSELMKRSGLTNKIKISGRPPLKLVVLFINRKLAQSITAAQQNNHIFSTCFLAHHVATDLVSESLSILLIQRTLSSKCDPPICGHIHLVTHSLGKSGILRGSPNYPACS